MMTPEEARIVAWTLLGEGAGEGRKGMEAIAHVIRNRSMTGRYPDNPASVALQNNGRGIHQFSTWNPLSQGGNIPRAKYPTNSREFNEALEIVNKVFSATPGKDPTLGATHYYSPKGMPGGEAPYWWRSESNGRSVKVGNHIFASKRDEAVAPTPAERRTSSFAGQDRNIVTSPVPTQLDPVTGAFRQLSSTPELTDLRKALETKARDVRAQHAMMKTLQQGPSARGSYAAEDRMPYVRASAVLTGNPHAAPTYAGQDAIRGVPKTAPTPSRDTYQREMQRVQRDVIGGSISAATKATDQALGATLAERYGLAAVGGATGPSGRGRPTPKGKVDNPYPLGFPPQRPTTGPTGPTGRGRPTPKGTPLPAIAAPQPPRPVPATKVPPQPKPPLMRPAPPAVRQSVATVRSTEPVAKQIRSEPQSVLGTAAGYVYERNPAGNYTKVGRDTSLTPSQQYERARESSPGQSSGSSWGDQARGYNSGRY